MGLAMVQHRSADPPPPPPPLPLIFLQNGESVRRPYTVPFLDIREIKINSYVVGRPCW